MRLSFQQNAQDPGKRWYQIKKALHSAKTATHDTMPP